METASRQPRDPVEAATRLFDALERSDAPAVEVLLGPERVAILREVHRWTAQDYIDKDWHPTLAELTGSPRRVRSVERIAQTGPLPDTWPVRLTIEGPRGRAYFTMLRFDESGLGSFGVAGEVCNGIGTIYIHCPQDRRQEVANFYALLLRRPLTSRGMRLSSRQLPSLAIAAARPGEPMPQWPNPEHPQQMHLDLLVSDVAEAGEAAEGAGATLLRDGERSRVYADPVGHPFCLCSDGRNEPALGRIVIDCFSPRALATFYSELLDMPLWVEDDAERVVIAAEDRRLPMLGFQHVAAYAPPRWGDPRFPQQLHFDLSFDDAPGSKERAERLGAIRLPPLGGTCPVYADPAGHPFCLCHVE